MIRHGNITTAIALTCITACTHDPSPYPHPYTIDASHCEITVDEPYWHPCRPYSPQLIRFLTEKSYEEDRKMWARRAAIEARIESLRPRMPMPSAITSCVNIGQFTDCISF